jgi:hypothetical protein
MPSMGRTLGKLSGMLGAVAAILLVASPSALAAAPANDNFANAQVIAPGLPVVAGGTNYQATAETGEPSHSPFGLAQASVWYRWTPTSTVDTKLDLCGETGFSSHWAAAYTGSQVNALTSVANSGGQCRMHFLATGGVTYQIAVDGFLAGGDFTLKLRPFSPPVNDDFANATTVGPALPVSQPGTTVDATAQSGEPNHTHPGGPGGAHQSIWYRWTPSSDSEVKIDACGNGPEGLSNVLAVYTGTQLDALAPVATDPSGYNDCDAHLSAVAGTTYRIAVDASFNEAAITFVIRALDPPPNDDFANAEKLGAGLPVTRFGTTTDATSETGEPDHGGGGYGPDATVWYRWTPTSNVTALVDVCDAEVIADSAVYTGSSLGSLVDVGSPSGYCRVRFSATAGTTYRVAVEGYGDGDFNLNLRPYSPPANDDFADAQTIGPGLPAAVEGTTVDATDEAGEPSHGGAYDTGSSVWYRWTPAVSGPVKVSLCNPGPAPEYPRPVEVYTGTQVGSLTEVASNEQFIALDCAFRFEAIAGTTYYISVDGAEAFTLGLHASSGPANDDFANAQTLPAALPSSTNGTNVDASKQTGEPLPGACACPGSSTSNSVWYSWTPTASTETDVTTCATNNGHGPSVGVYTGSQVNALSEVAASRECRIHFTPTPGATYRIEVTSSDEGPFVLDLFAHSPPANDAFADATPLATVPPDSESGTTIDATRQQNEPTPLGPYQGVFGYASVWFRWTPSVDQRVRLNTCDSEFNTVLAVYTGADIADLTRVASNDDGCSTGNASGSRLALDAIGGITYSIVVDGNYAAGPYALAIATADPPPPSPSLTGASPAGPADDNEPAITGSAVPGSIVTLYRNADCAGRAAATGTAEQLASTGLTARVADNSTTTFYATATLDGQTSQCSATGVSYQEATPPDSPPPPDQSAQPPAPVLPATSTPTGRRAAALKKCKRQRGARRRACVKRAKKLPV